jgi:Flp pilus assembly protein TadG
MKRSTSRPWKNRRGVIAVLAAVLFVVMLGMVAFAVDIGYMTMMQTQLQAAADSAALAAAGSSNLPQTGTLSMTSVAEGFAAYHRVAGRNVVLNDSDVQFGTWDTTALTFTAATSSSQLATAVKVTTRVASGSGGSADLFFGKIFGVSSATSHASAVAMVNPRDICFVVDLSSSMHCDTAPGYWATTHDDLIQAVYNDLFGAGHVTYTPGDSLTSLNTNDVKTAMTAINNSSTLKYLCPTPNVNDTASVQYWTDIFNNIGTDRSGNYQISYDSYVTLLMNHGRSQELVGGTGRYSIMSTMNPAYKQHTEVVGTGSFAHTFTNWPTPEMPTHALRRAVIAGLEVIQDRNSSIGTSNQKDQVSIVAFDRVGSYPTPVSTLTTDYLAVMQAAVTLQSCGATATGTQSCTDSEGGLIRAVAELNSSRGRANANKIIIFLTDGNANLYESPDSTIDQYMHDHTGGWDNDYASNGALMQAAMLQGNNWYLYAVGIGSDADQNFMNRMAVKGGTADSTGKAFTATTSSATCEATLTSIFNKIISNPKLRLVQ